MIFIDYLTLMLVNMSAGLFIFGMYVYKGVESSCPRKWAPALAVPGFVALVTGLHMIWTWPLPASYNIAFGELSVLLGTLFLGMAWAVGCGYDPIPVLIYALFAGAAAMVVGVNIMRLGLTRTPKLSAVGFILSGLGGLSAALVMHFRSKKWLRLLYALVLTVTALLWAVVGYGAYGTHLEGFMNWKPPHAQMRAPIEEAKPSQPAK